MKHLHYFKTREEYEEKRWMLYRPYVAYIEDEDKIERWEDETRTIAVFKTTIENENVEIFNTFLFDVNADGAEKLDALKSLYVSEMWVDGVKLDEPKYEYNFTKPGIHFVEYSFIGDEIDGYFNGLYVRVLNVGDTINYFSVSPREDEFMYPNGVKIRHIMLGNSNITDTNSLRLNLSGEENETVEVIFPSLENIDNIGIDFIHNLKKITIPDTVNSIGNFFACAAYNLDDVILGKNVKYISDRAFDGAVNGDFNVHIKSLKNIQKDNRNIDNLLKCGAYLFYNNTPLSFGQELNNDGSSYNVMSLKKNSIINSELYYKADSKINDFVIGESYFDNNAFVIEHRYDNEEGIGVIIFEGEIPSMEEVQELYPNLEIIEINNI